MPNDAETWFLTYGADEAAIDFLYKIPQIADLISGKSTKVVTYENYLSLIASSSSGANDPESLEGVGAVRIFHPKPMGHQIIAGKLASAIKTSSVIPKTK